MPIQIQQLLNNNRLQYLDGIRGVAAMMVVIFHCINCHWAYTPIAKFSLFIFNGADAVSLFFVLSGLVLSLHFFNGTYDATSFDYKKYIIKRFFRLMPVFWFVIILSYFYYHFSDFSNQLFWSNILNNTHKIGNQLLLIRGHLDAICLPAWSLSVELVLSIILPIFIFTYLYNKKYLYFMLFFVIIVSNNYFSIFTFHFILGIILAANFKSISQRSVSIIENNLPLIFVISVVLFSTRQLLKLITIPTYLLNWNMEFLQLDTFFFTALGSFGLLILSIRSSKVQSFFNNKIILFFGKISYPIYLIHCLMIAVFLNKITMLELYFGAKLAFFVFTIGVVVSSIVLSYIIHQYIEKPFIRIAKTYKS